MTVKRTAREWFDHAAHCYVEEHQGCAWCGSPHSVFRREERRRLMYTCSRCDFRVGYDETSQRHFFTPGEAPRDPAKDTHVDETM
jgi:hypothetical protein